MAPKILMGASAGIVLHLGLVHLVYTFTGSKLLPRDPAVQAAMAQVHMGITRETTVWRAWVGFNASHSMALILFGLVFGYLALAHTRFLFDSVFLLVVGFAMLAGMLVLARLYWFSAPVLGAGIALACYLAAIVAAKV
jgi:hypothetical protein